MRMLAAAIALTFSLGIAQAGEPPVLSDAGGNCPSSTQDDPAEPAVEAPRTAERPDVSGPTRSVAPEADGTRARGNPAPASSPRWHSLLPGMIR